MDVFYYDGVVYGDIEDVLKAVRQDLDFCIEDSDVDLFLRETGGIVIDGEELTSCISIKRCNYHAYRQTRNEVVDRVLSEIRDVAEQGLFPIRVPFTYNVLESGSS